MPKKIGSRLLHSDAQEDLRYCTTVLRKYTVQDCIVHQKSRLLNQGMYIETILKRTVSVGWSNKKIFFYLDEVKIGLVQSGNFTWDRFIQKIAG